MKNTWLLTIVLVLLSFSIAQAQETKSNKNNSAEGALIITGSAEFSELAARLAADYSHAYAATELKFNSLESLKNEHNQLSNVFILTNEIKNNALWHIEIGHDVIVPIVNAKNPHFGTFRTLGVSPKNMARYVEKAENRNYSTLTGNTIPEELNFYLIENKLIKEKILNFLKLKEISGIPIANGSELVSNIQKDKNAIGFCKLSDIVSSETGELLSGIAILPLDFNNNGKLDAFEHIYNNLSDFTRAVWIGKYSRELYSPVYLTVNEIPTSANQKALLNWLLTEGQETIKTSGYADLSFTHRQAILTQLAEPKELVISESESSFASVAITILYLLVALVGVLFLLPILQMLFSQKKSFNLSTNQPGTAAFSSQKLSVPGGLYYDKSHTWAYMEKNGTVKIGIDDFLQHTTGMLTQIKMKPTGEKIKKGEHVFTIVQKGKQLSVCAPISGTIKTINEKLNSDASLLNTSPYNQGWVYEIEPSNWIRETQFLQYADAYKTWLNTEFTRLKDFMASALQINQPELAPVMLQEGGELHDHLLEPMSPKVWEDFQANFMDISK